VCHFRQKHNRIRGEWVGVLHDLHGLVEVQKLTKIAICNATGASFAKLAIIGTYRGDKRRAGGQQRAESVEQREEKDG
jgi:hypothetical protein